MTLHLLRSLSQHRLKRAPIIDVHSLFPIFQDDMALALSAVGGSGSGVGDEGAGRRRGVDQALPLQRSVGRVE